MSIDWPLFIAGCFELYDRLSAVDHLSTVDA